ncbi:unnamed protein product [Rodentolepis nana]|uniref:ZU5 domain-containing protein n=1 Tax=Rodentolepis nana TaxID=102285 RepID=A0A158QJ03_RODNA|nr:unnamed protein product [Rodentolepis nana]
MPTPRSDTGAAHIPGVGDIVVGTQVGALLIPIKVYMTKNDVVNLAVKIPLTEGSQQIQISVQYLHEKVVDMKDLEEVGIQCDEEVYVAGVTASKPKYIGDSYGPDRVAAEASRITSAHTGEGGRQFTFTELSNPPAITSQYSPSAKPSEQSGIRCHCGRHFAAVSASSSPVEISCSSVYTLGGINEFEDIIARVERNNLQNGEVIPLQLMIEEREKGNPQWLEIMQF